MKKWGRVNELLPRSTNSHFSIMTCFMKGSKAGQSVLMFSTNPPELNVRCYCFCAVSVNFCKDLGSDCGQTHYFF